MDVITIEIKCRVSHPNHPQTIPTPTPSLPRNRSLEPKRLKTTGLQDSLRGWNTKCGNGERKVLGRELERISRVINMLMSFYVFKSYSKSVKEV